MIIPVTARLSTRPQHVSDILLSLEEFMRARDLLERQAFADVVHEGSLAKKLGQHRDRTPTVVFSRHAESDVPWTREHLYEPPLPLGEGGGVPAAG